MSSKKLIIATFNMENLDKNQLEIMKNIKKTLDEEYDKNRY